MACSIASVQSDNAPGGLIPFLFDWEEQRVWLLHQVAKGTPTCFKEPLCEVHRPDLSEVTLRILLWVGGIKLTTRVQSSWLETCGLALGHSGLGPEHTTAQMQSPLPGLLSALQLLSTVPFPVAGKGLWLPIPHDHSSPAQNWPVLQRGPKTVACPLRR